MTKRARTTDGESTTRKNRRRIEEDDTAADAPVDLTNATDGAEVAAPLGPASTPTRTGAAAMDAAVGHDLSASASSTPSAAASGPLAVALSSIDVKHANMAVASPHSAATAPPVPAAAAPVSVASAPAAAVKVEDDAEAMERSVKGLLGDLHVTLAQVQAKLKVLTVEENKESEELERVRMKRSLQSRQLHAQQRDVDTHIQLLMEAVANRDVVKMRSALLVKPKSYTPNTPPSADGKYDSKHDVKYSGSALSVGGSSGSSNSAYGSASGSAMVGAVAGVNRMLDYKPVPTNDGLRGAGAAFGGGGGGGGGFGSSPKKPGVKSPAKIKRAVDNVARYIRYVIDTRGAYEWQDRTRSDSSCRGCSATPTDHWLNDAKPDPNAAVDGAGQANAWVWVCPRTRELIEPPVME